MPQTINTFVKSKMNKDLDDRLLSNGEYRDAQNVNVSRSEGEDVGALENVLGNTLLSDFGLSAIPGLEIIGFLADEVNNRAFFMATNYTDPSDNQLDNSAPFGVNCYILMRDNKTSTSSILVQGRFLNFSKTHHIYGIDLIEDLLFWTDNRNQPRKINVTKAIADNTYYITEDQISVAKYYPYTPIQLFETQLFAITTPGGTGPTTGPHVVLNSSGALNSINLKVGMYIRDKGGVSFDATDPSTGVPLQVSRGPIGAGTTKTFYTNYAVDFGPNVFGTSQLTTVILPTSKNVSSEYLTPSSRGLATTGTSGATLVIPTNQLVGEVLSLMLVTCPGKITNKITVVSHSIVGPNIEIVCSGSITASPNSVAVNDIITFSWPNVDYKSNWPGDKDYLKDKFVRFAYRFKFDDGEYSLISPFTQPAFIPKQGGYLIHKQDRDNPGTIFSEEDFIKNSTILQFFENDINEVGLQIKTPFVVNELSEKLKIVELDILYKESDALAIKVLDSISVTDSSITSNSTDIYTYEYQSRKPFRTLPNREATRVFDKVPVRAMSQSVVGNRVVYGNFIDKHTPPENLPYNVQATPKYLPSNYSATSNLEAGNSFVAYPNHTLKQNRTYQVGIILSDRYGRQSDVVLSDLTSSQFYEGSASNLFNGSTIFHPYKDSAPSTASEKWFGDSLKVLFRDEIPDTVSYAEGYPGLYASGQETAQIRDDGGTYPRTTKNLPTEVYSRNIVKGSVLDQSGSIYTAVATSSSRTSLVISEDITIDIGDVLIFNTPENKLGWYTYKIVVKQQSGDYYNAYIPSLTQGIPTGTALTPTAYEGYIPLIGDNINKIPSDLQEVQPEQTQFRTSDEILFPRVGSSGTNNFNSQYFLNEQFVTVDTIGKITDLEIGDTTSTPIQADAIFQAKSNPTVAKLSLYETNIGGTSASASRKLSIFEVKPKESSLELYWETSSCGIISELNELIRTNASSIPPVKQPTPIPQ